MKTISKDNGISLNRFGGYAVCYIDCFTDELKEMIRKQLTAICYGSAKAGTMSRLYNYKSTIKEFLKRYNSKSRTTQLGMIGELLTHILILNYFEEYNTVSPYFNMEERSIKKGFDVVLFSTNDKELWITEVKSGELHKNKTASETVSDLLDTAKQDLKKRLNESEMNIWENAINGAKIALENKKDMKDAVVEILEDIGVGISNEQATSEDKNVILVASLFSNLNDKHDEKNVEVFSQKLSDENTFKSVIILTLQKETFQRVVDFLITEAE